MKISCLFLVIAFLPKALSRLTGNLNEIVESNVDLTRSQLRKQVSNSTEPIPHIDFRRNSHKVIDVFHLDRNENPGYMLGGNVTLDLPSEFVTADENIHSTPRHRDLQDTIEVVIENQCHRDFNLAIIYMAPSNQGTSELVYRGWYLVEAGESTTFNDVAGSSFSLYAISTDGTYSWKGEESTADHCFGSLCFRDYGISGNPVRSVHYLSCGDSTDRAVPSPTPRPPTASPGAQAQEWVNAHNTRRSSHHSKYNKSPVLVQWDTKVAASAQTYASKLASINGCVIQHGYQDDDFGGENLASRWSSPGTCTSSPNTILQRWYDNELSLQYPESAHMSQVAWRPTKHIGCGSVVKPFQDGFCCIHVCRYITPGNCNVPSNPSFATLNALIMQDGSPCSPQVP